MNRKLLLASLMLAHSVAVAQKVDSLNSTPSDSIFATPSMALSAPALGFAMYSAETSSLESANGISPLNALYSASPGLTMDGMPFPSSARFRSIALAYPNSMIKPAIVWDGIPYGYDDFLSFQLNGFNTGKITIGGPGSLFGYGPLANPGGILIDSKTASRDDDWAVTFNAYPALFGDHYTTVFLNNLSLSKGGPNTSVRFFYNQTYQPEQRSGNISRTKVSGNQAGLTLGTKIKRLFFNSSILAQKYRTETTTNFEFFSENVDVTAKGKLLYKLHPLLNLSILAGYDRNAYLDDAQTTRKRLFYRASFDFNKTFKTFSVFGSVAYQRDSSSIVDSRYSYSPEKQYEANSIIGTLGFSLNNLLWIRSTIQSNTFSIIQQNRKIYPAYFLSLDILRATSHLQDILSRAVLRINYSEAFNYAHMLSLASQQGSSYNAFFHNQRSAEAGFDLGFKQTGLAITYFWQDLVRQREDCPTGSGPCSLTDQQLQAVALSGVEIKLDQRLSFSKSVQMLVTAGGTLTWQRQGLNEFWSDRARNTHASLNTAVHARRFFGNVLVNAEDHYDRWDFAEVPVPLREISFGYSMPEINSRYLKSARVSFIGRNLITGNSNHYLIRSPYRIYTLNLSMRLR